MTDKKTRTLERVLEQSQELFLTLPFEDVTIREIAAKARCSAATIYDAFESKEKLFEASIEHARRLLDAPEIDRHGPDPLAALLEYARSRIVYFKSPATQTAIRSLFSKPQFEAFGRRAAVKYEHLDDVLSVASAAAQAGDVHGFAPSTVVFNIVSGASFDPLVSGLIFGDERHISVSKTLDKIFTPLVTPRGRITLDAFLTSIQREQD